jgi:rare lipoprotein A
MKNCIPLSILVSATALLLSSCSTTEPAASKVASGATKTTANASVGIASIYTDKILSNGKRYSASAMAAAHKTIPLGSKVRVVNLRNGKTTVGYHQRPRSLH